MAKKIFYEADAREKVLSGAKQLYDAVKVTLLRLSISVQPKKTSASKSELNSSRPQLKNSTRSQVMVLPLLPSSLIIFLLKLTSSSLPA